jgi:hypothetical protein
VGVLSRLFRILHPLSYAKRRVKRALIPRPIRRAKWVAGGVAHPVSRAKYSARRAVIRKVDKALTPKRKRRPAETGAVKGGRPMSLRTLRLVVPTAFAALILAACGSADQASLPTTGASAAVVTATATSVPSVAPTPTPTPPPTPQPVPVAPKVTAPPPPSPAFNYCGAPANPWHYNFCGGNVIYVVPASFCSYFPCIPSFWQSTKGYAEECHDGMYSHSGGRPGACSYHDGELRALLQ